MAKLYSSRWFCGLVGSWMSVCLFELLRPLKLAPKCPGHPVIYSKAAHGWCMFTWLLNSRIHWHALGSPHVLLGFPGRIQSACLKRIEYGLTVCFCSKVIKARNRIAESSRQLHSQRLVCCQCIVEFIMWASPLRWQVRHAWDFGTALAWFTGELADCRQSARASLRCADGTEANWILLGSRGQLPAVPSLLLAWRLY